MNGICAHVPLMSLLVDMLVRVEVYVRAMYVSCTCNYHGIVVVSHFLC